MGPSLDRAIDVDVRLRRGVPSDRVLELVQKRLARLRGDLSVLVGRALFSQAESVSRKRASGRSSAELFTPYPPGIPAVAPGGLSQACTGTSAG